MAQWASWILCSSPSVDFSVQPYFIKPSHSSSMSVTWFITDAAISPDLARCCNTCARAMYASSSVTPLFYMYYSYSTI